MLDEATKIMVMVELKDVSTASVIDAVEKGWSHWFHVPGRIRFDEMAGFTSEDILDWSSKHGFFSDVAPGEAHERLGTVERRNAVAREALETFAASQSDSKIKRKSHAKWS